MKVSDLYDKPPFAGESVHIVGTGPSMSVFPTDYLKDEFCILLNDGWKYFSELGPCAFSNNLNFLEGCGLPYRIVKARLKFQYGFERDDNHVPWNHPHYYCYSYRDRRHDEWDHFDEQALWSEPCHYWNTPGGNSAIFCIQFCLLAGVRKITLVGCDCCSLEKHDYVDQKRERRVKHNYEAYARGEMRMIREASDRFGVPIVQVNPFAGIGRETIQFREMKSWKKQSESASAASRCS